MRADSEAVGVRRTCRDQEPPPGPQGHEASSRGRGVSGGRPNPWCLSGTASGLACVPSMSDSTTPSGRDWGGGVMTAPGVGERGRHPP